jgi:uncharacterized membrane protein YadS
LRTLGAELPAGAPRAAASTQHKSLKKQILAVFFGILARRLLYQGRQSVSGWRTATDVLLSFISPPATR